MKYELVHGDCIEVLRKMEDNSVDAVVTDPPYGLSFMGKRWDYEVPSVEMWIECLRVLKPGGYVLSFAGSRTYHRMAVNIEDAGFEIRDQIMWVYGTGFPKSHNISKEIDKRGGKDIRWFGEWLKKWRTENGISRKEVAKLFPSKQQYGGKEASGKLTGCVGNWETGYSLPTNEQFNKICKHFNLPFENMEAVKGEYLGEITHSRSGGDDFAKQVGSKSQSKVEEVFATATEPAKKWEGWGSALKPAHEPIVVARKPLIGTIVENVLEHGTGGLNIDGCRIGTDDDLNGGAYAQNGTQRDDGWGMQRGKAGEYAQPLGRFPANFIHDGSDEVVSLFPQSNGSAIKPAHEPIVVARKPLIGTIVENVLEHGTGGLNIDACRVKHDDPMITRKDFESNTGDIFTRAKGDEAGPSAKGRFPANFIHDGSDEVVSLFPESNGGAFPKKSNVATGEHYEGGWGNVDNGIRTEMGDGSAARFFYCAKASQEEKHRGIEHNDHPTVKPVDLMKYLCRLITPPNGVVLDPFMGSGTTGIGATAEGFSFIGIEREEEYISIARHRISHWVEEKEEQVRQQRAQKSLFDW